MSKRGHLLVNLCIFAWFIATVLIIPGAIDSDRMTWLEALENWIALSVGFLLVCAFIGLLDKGVDRAKSNIDKAINCLQMDRLNETKDFELLLLASEYIEKELYRREKEAKRLAERKASSN